MLNPEWLLGLALNLSTPSAYPDFPDSALNMKGASLENPAAELRLEAANRLKLALRQSPYLQCGVFYAGGRNEGQFIQTAGLDCDLGIEWKSNRRWTSSLGVEQDLLTTPTVHVPCYDGLCISFGSSESGSVWGRGMSTLKLATSAFVTENVNLEASLGASPSYTTRSGIIDNGDGSLTIFEKEAVGGQWVIGVQANRAF